MEEKNKFLHGTLEATIFYATPYTPQFPLKCLITKGKPAYVTIKIDKEKVSKTTRSRDRVWNQTFEILCAHRSTSTIIITLKNSCTTLGSFKLGAQRLLGESSLIDGFFPLNNTNEDSKELVDVTNGINKPKLIKLRLLLWFKPAELEPSWERVINNGESYEGQRNATFPMRSNCHVALYQDAHHCSDFRPPVGLCGTPRRLWEDVYKAIEGAKYLVYIAGWSFNPKLVLVREEDTEIPEARGVRIGDLLKRKAEEGVSVRILLWDDETSLPLLRNAGLMRTHDQDSLSFFRHSKVLCHLTPRRNIFFSHHQKTLTLDSAVTDHRLSRGAGSRELVSFIGGLDFCDGRYDTDRHSLFSSGEFYQTSIAGANPLRGGPREPWHDSHARVRGRAALDILSNFEQRWALELGPSQLVPRSTISDLANNDNSVHYDWNVQVFRSIDGHVLPSRSPERSVHRAYVEAIRRAERFIYVENQYFMGGCHLWYADGRNGDSDDSGCRNLIPVEIALKIAAKIRAKQRFCAYVVIPMWPEGVPESESVGDMLHWTRQTMTMMYGLIGNAIEESGGMGHPTDYLSFFCLGNRESGGGGDYVAPYAPRTGTNYWSSQRNRRFMIYVHSKLMIVDDLYLVIGSANINQRSMDGERDTEIAIGCYQSKNSNNNHNFIDTNTNENDIRAFRMSLWYEHTRLADDIFLEPQSRECVRKMRSTGDKMWKIYCGKELIDMEGVHLMTYPIGVTQNGVIEDLYDTHFPDTNAPIKGKRSKILPPIFTT